MHANHQPAPSGVGQSYDRSNELVFITCSYLDLNGCDTLCATLQSICCYVRSIGSEWNQSRPMGSLSSQQRGNFHHWNKYGDIRDHQRHQSVHSLLVKKPIIPTPYLVMVNIDRDTNRNRRGFCSRDISSSAPSWVLAEPPRVAQQKLDTLWLPVQDNKKKKEKKRKYKQSSCATLVKQQQPTSILIGLLGYKTKDK